MTINCLNINRNPNCYSYWLVCLCCIGYPAILTRNCTIYCFFVDFRFNLLTRSFVIEKFHLRDYLDLATVADPGRDAVGLSQSPLSGQLKVLLSNFEILNTQGSQTAYYTGTFHLKETVVAFRHSSKCTVNYCFGFICHGEE